MPALISLRFSIHRRFHLSNQLNMSHVRDINLVATFACSSCLTDNGFKTRIAPFLHLSAAHSFIIFNGMLPLFDFRTGEAPLPTWLIFLPSSCLRVIIPPAIVLALDLD